MKAKISVIIPIYNQAKYISQCLDSILSQTLKELEIVCINDGSTDESLSILKQYAHADKRIVVVSRQNKGVGPSRNEGVSIANGEYLAFMDPDDYYPESYILENMFRAGKENNAQIVGGSLLVYDEERAKEIKKLLYPECFKKSGYINYSEFQYDYGFQRFIYSADLIRNKKIIFPAYKRFQDPPFMIKAMIAAGQFYAIPQYVYAYRWSQKFSKWDKERAVHLASALRDNIVDAVRNELWDLFDLTLSRIQADFKTVFIEHASDQLSAILDEIMRMSIDATRKRFRLSHRHERPAVSVVIPIYNTEKYLGECLESLRKQTICNIEFICVNDGSTDNTLKILKDYAARDGRFVFVNKPNAGYGQAVNVGIELATGQYLGIVEPDDFVAPDMYAVLYKIAVDNDVDIVKSGLYHYWGTGEKRKVSVSAISDIIGRVINPRKDLRIFDAVMNNVTGLYRRLMIERANIRLNETPGASYQDNSLYLQLHYNAGSVYLLDNAYYYYRQDNESSSINSKGKAFVIFEEYRLNDLRLRSHKDQCEAFMGSYVYKKFKSYKFHLGRIDASFRLEFLERMQKEFTTHENLKEIDWAVIPKGHADILRSIIKDPKIYYNRCVQIDKGTALYRKFKHDKYLLRKMTFAEQAVKLESMSVELKKAEAQHAIDWSQISEGHKAIIKQLIVDWRVYHRRLQIVNGSACDAAKSPAKKPSKSVVACNNEKMVDGGVTNGIIDKSVYSLGLFMFAIKSLLPFFIIAAFATKEDGVFNPGHTPMTRFLLSLLPSTCTFALYARKSTDKSMLKLLLPYCLSRALMKRKYKRTAEEALGLPKRLPGYLYFWPYGFVIWVDVWMKSSGIRF